MSDQPQAQGWWQASDGQYYPPDIEPPLPPPPLPPLASTKRFLITLALTAIGAVVVALIAATVFNRTRGGSKHAITGHMVLSGSDAQLRLPVGSACDGRDGYDDIQAGTSVSIANDAGKLIATGHLEAGSVVAPLTCSFAFTIKGVPDSAFYRVTISHRGELSYSKADLSSKGWNVEATLGG